MSQARKKGIPGGGILFEMIFNLNKYWAESDEDNEEEVQQYTLNSKKSGGFKPYPKYGTHK